MKKIQTTIFSLLVFSNIFCQVSNEGTLTKVPFNEKKDSLLIEGDEFVLFHYNYSLTPLQKRKIIVDPESIFIDSLNNYSRLVFKSLRYGSFNVPSVPLSQIIYLKESGVIIGLSKFDYSPYHVVIYSTKGELLSKRILASFELKFTMSELRDLLKKHPALYDCLGKNIIVKDNDDYYIEPSNCVISIIGKDSLLKMDKLVSNHYFPLMNISMDTQKSKYHSSFSDSDPLYDLIMIGSVPYLLILNSEDGKKVNLPLLSSVSFGCNEVVR